jgi:hypothetical protein
MLIGGTIAATVQLMLLIWFAVRLQRHQPDRPAPHHISGETGDGAVQRMG